MQTETLIEGRPSLVKLDRHAARYLVDVGRRLASKKAWWGEESPPEDRTVIACRETDPGMWQVTVRDAVGLISLGEVQLLIEPKIPREHLFFLLGRSGAVPRLTEDKGWIEAGADLWELIATWYLRCAESVLRRDLVRDYLELVDDLLVVRGQIDPIATGRDFYRGTLTLRCQYEDLGIDTPLNRILRAAARAVARSTELPWHLRQRAMRITSRMDDVGDLRPHDLHARTDRRTAHYGDALALARHILHGERRTIGHGDREAWTFLIRTPEMVEEGLRKALAERLGTWDVSAGTIQLGGTTMTVNPDLVFNRRLAVADVKYKLSGTEWRRPDLYQAVAFAAAARAQYAAVIGFSASHRPSTPEVRVGEISVTSIDWQADERLAPDEAADDLARRVRTWLERASAGR